MAGLLGDLYQFDFGRMMWINYTDLVGGAVPIAREGHGFTQASNRNLYMFGGSTADSEACQLHLKSLVLFLSHST